MADQTAFEIDAFQEDPLAFQEIVTTPAIIPPVVDTSLVEFSGERGGYLVGPPQFGDKTRPGAAYPNDVVLPVYDPNTMRPGPLPPSTAYSELMAERVRKRKGKLMRAVAVAMLLWED